MSNYTDLDKNDCKGCYPKCLRKPFILFILLIIVLFIIAFVFCSSCRRVEVKSPDISALQKPNLPQAPMIKEPEPVKVEPTKEAKVDNIELIKEAFLKDGTIDSSFSLKDSVFFDKNSSSISKNANKKFEKAIQDEVNSAKLVIVVGHACDLGSVAYNRDLIQKRINSVMNVISAKNPNIDIVAYNAGQIKNPLERTKDRRVDIYFYK